MYPVRFYLNPAPLRCTLTPTKPPGAFSNCSSKKTMPSSESGSESGPEYLFQGCGFRFSLPARSRSESTGSSGGGSHGLSNDEKENGRAGWSTGCFRLPPPLARLLDALGELDGPRVQAVAEEPIVICARYAIPKGARYAEALGWTVGLLLRPGC